MRVTKRDGSIVSFDISKVKQVVAWATAGIDVNPMKLESHVDVIFTDTIKTSDIQANLIQKAVELVSLEEPDWKYVAGRLSMMTRWKKLRSSDSFLFSVKDMVEKGLYDKQILSFYSDSDIETLGSYIQRARDLDYDYAGSELLLNRYLLPEESPQQAFMVVSMWLASTEEPENRIVMAEKFYDAISLRKISLATPILSNLRKPDANLASCFITMPGDSLESIFDVVTQAAQISKHGGGVGINLSNIRSRGAQIKHVQGASGGVIPWIRILNDTAVAVNQLGNRAGAITPSLDIWHPDIEDFLELQTENGDQRRKSYDVFPQVVITDNFMRAVEDDYEWYLIDPKVSGYRLPKLWGAAFDRAYRELIAEGKYVKKVRARDLFKRILKSQIETGMPYITFKDTINAVNPNSHTGYIPAGNLCQESFSNVAISTDQMSTTEIHTCNLCSLNLSNIDNYNELETYVSLAVRILDNAIDFTKLPIEQSKVHNTKYRTIGIGVMGLADYLVKNGSNFDAGLSIINEIFENIQYFAVKASIGLAQSRGAYPSYEGSAWDSGAMFEHYKNISGEPSKWYHLEDELNTYGIRNSQLTAIAPNTSTSLLQGCTPSVLPIFNKLYYDSNARGSVPVLPPFIKQYPLAYKPYKLMDHKKMNLVIAVIQQWIDTGISYEMIFDLNDSKVTAKYIYDVMLDAWKKGIKTIYYIRSIQKDSSMRTKEECSSCAN